MGAYDMPGTSMSLLIIISPSFSSLSRSPASSSSDAAIFVHAQCTMTLSTSIFRY